MKWRLLQIMTMNTLEKICDKNHKNQIRNSCLSFNLSVYQAGMEEGVLRSDRGGIQQCLIFFPLDTVVYSLL